ncbi:MAG: hypothetical protein WC451_06040 [Patescibacteria group bacterium]|jgi:hypothetical protein
MKRIFLVIGFWLIFVSSSFAAGSCVLTHTADVDIDGRKTVELTCTGDGSITAYTFVPGNFGVKGWYLYSVTTDPGTAPTADYDITFLVNGEDIAGSLLLNRSATLTQTVVIAPTTLGYHISKDDIVITFTNNTANPSVIVMTLRFVTN